MTEIMCRDCLEFKPRVRAEEIPGRKGSHYFRDLNGKRWQGRRCPQCHISSVKSRHCNVPPTALAPLSDRKCRACGGFLPIDRYFKHRKCDYAHFCYASNGQTETIWTPEDWGCGVVTMGVY